DCASLAWPFMTRHSWACRIERRMFKVSWENSEEEVRTVEELDRLLDKLHSQYPGERPVLVTIEIPESGDSMGIGLGREVSVLNYVSGSRDPPYFTSRGTCYDGPPLVFRFMGDLSELPRCCAIPVSVAREALRYFCRSG